MRLGTAQADTVYELHHTGSYLSHTHRKSWMRETVFWRVFHLQQTKENVSHVKITKGKKKGR